MPHRLMVGQRFLVPWRKACLGSNPSGASRYKKYGKAVGVLLILNEIGGIIRIAATFPLWGQYFGF